MLYTVKPGDTLSEIATKHGVTMSALLAANPVCHGNPNMIRVGQVLNLITDPVAPMPRARVDAVSDKAVELIMMFEVSSPQEYNLRCRAPSWPQGQSGVTIGVGYDLGYVSPAQFQADWGSRLDAEELARLGAVCGVTGPAAQSHIAGLTGIAVPWAVAEDMFRARTIPEYVARTREALANTSLLSPDSFGALVSLVYNRGAAFTAAGDRSIEMRAIHACMAAEDFAAIPGHFREMKRLWQNDPALAGLVTRREQEAALFEQGLAAPAPVPASAVNQSP